MRLKACDVMDGRVLLSVIGALLLAAAAYEYMLLQGLASAA
ncbi:putative membrane protein [Synechococcus sp. A15-60]|nr:putative membrane protein [Synechococcus sp. A15-60]